MLCPPFLSGGAHAAEARNPAASASHWAFQPVRKPALPAVKDESWPRSPIDHFILAKLEAAGLKPSPRADPRTLVRRVSFDLIGLPPTFEDVEAFRAGSSNQSGQSDKAFSRLVDHLLASPHYGERWGRHWLDVARYADTKDLVLLYGADRIRPYAHTYRDYVIRAFNEDTPYDRFIHEQLAADQIEPKVEPWRLGAMGFLTLGRLFDNNPHDIYDDQIDTVTRGLLGLTVSCARCHDHKYDPVPMADYYSLYGVFASSETPLELPLTSDPSLTPGSDEFEKKAAPIREELRRHIEEQYAHITDTARKRTGDYLASIATKERDPLEDAVFFLSLSPDDLRPQFITRWRRHLAAHARPDHPVFGLWHDVMALPARDLAARAPEVLAKWNQRPAGTGAGQFNPLIKEAFTGKAVTTRENAARAYGEAFARAYQQWKERHAAGNVPPAAVQLADILTGRDGPLHFPKSQTYLYMSRVPREKYHGKEKELDKLAVTAPGAPPRAMVLTDAPEAQEPRIFIRGNPLQPGEAVPRQFLGLLTPGERRPFEHGSGRLELARAITGPRNPLAARVIVNRVWMHHFGEPLVATPADFGTRSDPPTHPELLDWLAATFMERGWSLKELHRLIVNSAAYQQSSAVAVSPRLKSTGAGQNSGRALRSAAAQDPDNRLLWRAHRRRLDLEAMRDAMLFVSGRLDTTMGGRQVDVAGDPQNRRRTVYGLVDRQSLPALFRAFDFASPDQTASRRPMTTTPQQALFGMNSPFVHAQSQSLARRAELASNTGRAARVEALYRLALQRDPDRRELARALGFLDEAAKDGQEAQLKPLEQFAQALLVSNEFMFID